MSATDRENEDIVNGELTNESESAAEGELELGAGDSASELKGLAVASEVLPNTLPVLPLKDRAFFPVQTMPVVVPEAPWLKTMEQVGDSPHRLVVLVKVLDSADFDALTPEDFHEMGTVVRVHQAARAEGQLQFVAEGQSRARLQRWVGREHPFVAQVDYLQDEVEEDDKEVRAYAMAVMSVLKELIPLNPLFSEELKQFLNRFSPNNPGLMADFAGNLSSATGDQLQDLLETLSVKNRLALVLEWLRHDLEAAKLQTQIRQEVEEKIGEQQRQFFLKEQLKVIQSELGISKDDRTADIEEFKERLEGLALSDEANERVEEELGKLAMLERGSPEYAVTRNYLDWVTSLPWGGTSTDILDLPRARNVLDSEHTGLQDVKDRIVEVLAVGKLRGGVGGSIILLVGPPGVGKTSIGKSVASALGREFYRFSVGGMRDEAEIKGHRRTYIGAMPGKFVQALKQVGTANPVVMLDEIDKIGSSYQGDPASALLEVLDPEQNSEFLDHYLDLRLDLSQCLFIATANQLDTIPQPLMDRMEIIRLSGYITEEKVGIARDHLWPRLLKRNGLTSSKVRISDSALTKLVNGYAREAGVRGLEKQLGRIVRKTAVKIVEGESKRINVGARNLEDFVGAPIFQNEKVQRAVGVVTGLAWTAMGGATLSIEASQIHTKNRGFKLTGQLGDVMRESAEIAYSYVMSHLTDFGGDAAFFDEAFVHLHVPEGATPKDGPSAGITMASALLSLARSKRPKLRVAMTGELTLTGSVLAVGGIREKVVAAKRIGIKTLILPAANRRDVEELPSFLADGLTIHFAEHFSDVVEIIF